MPSTATWSNVWIPSPKRSGSSTRSPPSWTLPLTGILASPAPSLLLAVVAPPRAQPARRRAPWGTRYEEIQKESLLKAKEHVEVSGIAHLRELKDRERVLRKKLREEAQAEAKQSAHRPLQDAPYWAGRTHGALLIVSGKRPAPPRPARRRRGAHEDVPYQAPRRGRPPHPAEDR